MPRSVTKRGPNLVEGRRAPSAPTTLMMIDSTFAVAIAARKEFRASN